MEIARRFEEVSRGWVHQVRRRLEKDGRARSSFQIGGHRRSRLEADREPVLRAWIAAEPDLTLAELQQRLAQQGLSVKVGALWHQLNQWKLTFKKKLCTPASKSARTCKWRGAPGARYSRTWT